MIQAREKVRWAIFEFACYEGNYGLPNILAGNG